MSWFLNLFLDIGEALDFVVGEAKMHGVKLILSLVNNYNDYGGKPQYVQWARNAGTPINNDDDFYTNSVTKDYYKNHVKVCSFDINNGKIEIFLNSYPF